MHSHNLCNILLSTFPKEVDRDTLHPKRFPLELVGARGRQLPVLESRSPAYFPSLPAAAHPDPNDQVIGKPPKDSGSN